MEHVNLINYLCEEADDHIKRSEQDDPNLARRNLRIAAELLSLVAGVMKHHHVKPL